MKEDLKKVYCTLIALTYFAAAIFGIMFYLKHDTKSIFLMLVLFWIASLMFFTTDLRNYLIHLFFFLAIFLFLFSRPFIEFVQTGSFITYNSNTYQFAFGVLSLSMAGLLVGAVMGKKIPFRRKNDCQKIKSDVNDGVHIKHLRMTSLCVFLASYPFYVLRILEKWAYKRETSYYEYYASFQSELPYIVYLISVFMFFSMCVYLATKPPKKQSTVVLLLYIFANTIYLFIGTRNPFMLSLVFAFMYYCMRQFGDDKEIWIGKFEKFLMICSVPVLMVLMGLMNYVRDGAKIEHSGLLDILVDFVYKQGTSFGVLAKGYLYNFYLPIREVRNYTFGPIIDYVYRGSIGNTLFGTIPLPERNSLELAYSSNSYAHNISYVVMGDGYLDGHGIGSSYIMELYTDFGYLGVIIFSVLLGILFIYMMRTAYQKKVLPFALSLVIMENIFFTPRAGYVSSLMPIFTMQFWFVIAIIFIGTSFLERRKIHKGEKECLINTL